MEAEGGFLKGCEPRFGGIDGKHSNGSRKERPDAAMEVMHLDAKLPPASCETILDKTPTPLLALLHTQDLQAVCGLSFLIADV